jgi:hypothetical protein
MHSLAQLLVGGRTPTQIAQPYEHGTGHRKATGLFLTPNLPPLTPTCLVDDRVSAMADLSRSPNCGSLRSRTYVGIAAGPLVVTTSFLDTLPGDVCMTRSLDERPAGTILGPDGSPPIARGYAHLTFSLSGYLFRHKFLVIEGNPMLLLGNDFLAAHSANIKLNCNGDEGTISLSSATCGVRRRSFTSLRGLVWKAMLPLLRRYRQAALRILHCLYLFPARNRLTLTSRAIRGNLSPVP